MRLESRKDPAVKKLSVAALFLSAAAGSAGAAMLPPLTVEIDRQTIPVAGCHADVRLHHVPEIRRSAAHYHREDCRPVIVDQPRGRQGQPADCHRDVRTHRVGGVKLTHRHVGDDCQIREVRRSTG
jgi:hypothetical protein